MKILYQPKEITKYFRDQRPPVSLEGKFCDPMFKPCNLSLDGRLPDGTFLDREKGAENAKIIDLDETGWARASDLIFDPVLFSSSIGPDAVEQGSLGNCYFLSAIAALSKFPFFVYNLFKTKEINDNCLYEIYFFIDGEWQIVVIDDYVPIDKDSKDFKFTKAVDNQLWVVLLAKAWAKINTCYALVDGGFTSDTFLTFCGFSSSSFDPRDLEENDIKERLIEAKANNFMITAGTLEGIKNASGLVDGHYYSVFDVFEYENKSKEKKLAVTLRNPWGSEEWTGTWDFKTKKITKELAEKQHLKYAKEGIFNMPLDKFKEYFDQVEICHTRFGSNFKVFNHSDPEDLMSPHVYCLDVEKSGEYSISLFRDNNLYHREYSGLEYYMCMAVGQYDKNGKFSSIEVFEETTESLKVLIDLQKGKYAIWWSVGYYTMPLPKFNKAILRVNADSHFKLEYSGKDSGFAVINKMFLDASGLGKIESKSYGLIKSDYDFQGTDMFVEYYVNTFKNTDVLVKYDNSTYKGVLMFDQKEGKRSIRLKPGQTYVISGVVRGEKVDYTNDVIVKKSNKTSKPGVGLEFMEEAKNMLLHSFSPVKEGYYNYSLNSIKDIKFKNEFPRAGSKELIISRISKVNETLAIMLGKMSSDDSFWVTEKTENLVYYGQIDEDYNWKGACCVIYEDTGVNFVGYTKDSFISGRGYLVMNDGEIVYEGRIQDGLREGKGTSFEQGRKVYEGKFKQDEFEGEGVYFLGDEYWIGLFKQGKPVGEGYFVDKRGKRTRGELHFEE